MEKWRTFFLLSFLSFAIYGLLSLVVADDAAIMNKLAVSLSPAPSDWSGTDPCNWTGVSCDANERITAIGLASKSLTGALPSDLNQLTQLRILDVNNNHITGPLPSLANLTNLQQVYLDSNNFSSVPGSFLTGLISLQTLSLSENSHLEPWSIPLDLAQSSSLVTLYASNANVMGTIPDIFGSLPNLQSLRLSYSNLTGILPPSLKGSYIKNLWLNSQAYGLSGTIDVLGTIAQLSQVWLHANKFSGPIPDLSKSTSLFDLQLRDNQYTGIVPETLMSLPSLQNVTLQNNKLQGPYPQFKSSVNVAIGTNNNFCNQEPGPCDPQVTALLSLAGGFGYPISLSDAWDGNDACQGWSFVTCQGTNVTGINLGMQQLSGTISSAIANFTSLKNLYPNDNNLTGPIPIELTGLTQLQTLDVSNNNLTGIIPDFPASLNLKTSGNPLLGNVFATSGSSTSVSPGLIAGAVTAVVVFLGIASIISYKCYSKKRHQKFGQVHENGKEIQLFEGENAVIPIEVLQRVTDNFSGENILGRGGFGVVYKGKLHDGTQIAVKRMESASMGTKGLREFHAEVSMLRRVKHRHLVAVLGFCINGNERFLIYEFMSQGTLGQHLFKWNENKYPPLTWKERVIIALDVARGLEYLHIFFAQQSFIHRDLKPSNILLGDGMRAKVADFGLVKNTPDEKCSLYTRVAGTFGYLAPEYAATERVTTKVDVYAFGVVLMELITGRKVVDTTVSEEEFHLVTWFRGFLTNKDNIREAIDPTLDPDDETLGNICKVAELADHCTREPSQRPDMVHLVNALSPLVEHWEPTFHEDEEILAINLQRSLSSSFVAMAREIGIAKESLEFRVEHGCN
uniref:Protein kinase domain-containing protein n=1 Tax=Nelumbo nucifera TaxID=4432 RepID=A0A822ZS12_NELNU|nr:TPA_asm: hypothetical protein HUJ06_004369 [Nelumbo nucifera]